ncbi:hypothetical protein O181_061451, partial [Austropuccinia psidii MF-1]|nr:hypothetical protein [Austropuccinia psidii MF-1]
MLPRCSSSITFTSNRFGHTHSGILDIDQAVSILTVLWKVGMNFYDLKEICNVLNGIVLHLCILTPGRILRQSSAIDFTSHR